MFHGGAERHFCRAKPPHTTPGAATWRDVLVLYSSVQTALHVAEDLQLYAGM